jgi:hypothetical protein
MKHVQDWSEGECDLFVHERIADAAKHCAPLLADALIEAKGPKGAAAWVIEKENAVVARCGPQDEGVHDARPSARVLRASYEKPRDLRVTR